MEYTEKFTWGAKQLIIKRETSPIQLVSAGYIDAMSGYYDEVKLEKINVNDPALRPSNVDKAEGTPMPILQAAGVRIDLSKRTRVPMNFWHRNMDCDEVIFCYKGGINWETELGNISLKSGEMFVIPKGIAHRSLPPENSTEENIIIELKINGEVKKLI
jgi:quercetin dioxygenase-like cupin family protein